MLTMSVEADEESYAVDMRHHSIVVSTRNVLLHVQFPLYVAIVISTSTLKIDHYCRYDIT